MKAVLVIVSLLVTLVLGTWSLFYWLSQSQTGLDWIVAHLDELSYGSIHIESAEGKLQGESRLGGIEIRLEQGTVQIDAMVLETDLVLFPPQIVLHKLRIGHITLPPQTETEAEFTLPRWPRLPAYSGLLKIDQADIRLAAVRDSDAKEEPLLADLAAQLNWCNGTLNIDAVSVRAGQVSVQGHIHAGFASPRLDAAVAVKNLNADTGWQQINAELALLQSRKGLQGPLQLILELADGEQVRLNSAAALLDGKIDLSDLTVTDNKRGGTIAGHLLFTESPGSYVSGELILHDLCPLAEQADPKISGTVNLTINQDGYSALFKVTSELPQLETLTASGRVQGDARILRIEDLSLQSAVARGQGASDVDLLDKTASFTFTSAPVPLQSFLPELSGELQLQVRGLVRTDARGAAMGHADVALVNSRLQGLPIRGQARVHFGEAGFHLQHLEITGQDLAFNGRQDQEQQLQYGFSFQDLGRIVPGAGGVLAGEGTLGLQKPLAVSLTGTGKDFSYQQWRMHDLKIKAQFDAEQTFVLAADLRQLQQQEGGAVLLDSGSVSARGNFAAHSFVVQAQQADNSARMAGAGGWQSGIWSGHISALSLLTRQASAWNLQHPVPLTVSGRSVDVQDVVLQGDRQQRVTLSLHTLSTGLPDNLDLRWQYVSLFPLNYFLTETHISGTTSGQLRLRLGAESFLNADVAMDSDVLIPGFPEHHGTGHLTLSWDGLSLNGRATADFGSAGTLSGLLGVPSLPDLTSFAAGSAEFELKGFSATLLDPWIDSYGSVTGLITGQMRLDWAQDMALSGKGQFASSDLKWYFVKDVDPIEVESFSLGWTLQKDLLARTDISLKSFGTLTGRLRLPLLNLRPDTNAPWLLETAVEINDMGLFEQFYPDLVQDPAGRLTLQGHLAGTLAAPLITGNFQLLDASVLLPAAGIALESVSMQGDLTDNRMHLKEFKAVSGSGQVQIEGNADLSGARLDAFQGKISGADFQLLDLPNLQLTVSPELTVSGNIDAITLAGKVTIPRMLAQGSVPAGQARNSSDLVVIDRPQQHKTQVGNRYHLDLGVELGQAVAVKLAGIDARLTGQVRVQSTRNSLLATTGTLTVAEGRYSSYGVGLDIERGELHFVGGPPESPYLDVLAVRKGTEIKAGVKITGTPQDPVVTLYSDPAMNDTDILSYVVLGRTFSSGSSSTEETSLMTTAASALLSQGESAVLQEKIKSKLGLDVLDFSAGGGDMDSAVITTGKYLTPDLYVSLGYSLFKNSNEVKVRYSLIKKWEIESSFGDESGVDLFYRIEVE